MGKTPLLIALRRRANISAFCLFVIVLVGLSLASNLSSTTSDAFLSVAEFPLSVDDPSSINVSASDDKYGRGRLMHYLDIISSLRSKYRPAKGSNDRQGHSLKTGIDHRPPTLQGGASGSAGGTRFRHTVDEKTGFLTVNPDGAHPIFDLVASAEKRWKDKLTRASKTLDEAVKEYKRRYNRPPPRGFDGWWAYVQEHNVQLPDEYDSIYEENEKERKGEGDGIFHTKKGKMSAN